MLRRIRHGVTILDLPPPPADARLTYGDDRLQFGDLRLPSGPGPHPLVVWIHGGFWRARYDLEHAGHACAALTRAGIATWNVEYRRLGNPGGGWPGTFLDVAAAADFVRQLARRHAIDLDRVVVAGHSAGGHLALWLAGRQHVPESSPLYRADPFRFRGVVSLAGVCDLRSGWQQRLSNGVVGELMQGEPSTTPERYAAANPAELLPLGIPQALIHGTRDENVPYAISASYAAAARAAGDTVQLVPLSGAGHFEPIDPRAPEWSVTERVIRQMIGETE